MTPPSNSSQSNSSTSDEVNAVSPDTVDGNASANSSDGSNHLAAASQSDEALKFLENQPHARGTLNSLTENVPSRRFTSRRLLTTIESRQPPLAFIIFLAIVVMGIGLTLQNTWIGLAGASVALLVSLRVLWIGIRAIVIELLSEEQRALTVSTVGIAAGVWGILQLTGSNQRLGSWVNNFDWEAIGASGEVFGALGQILIAVITVYIAWRQYVISKDLTIQQNVITQQQTIDSYFQGISDLVLDAEGLLEDWPQERAIAEGRTAAILSSVDAGGKAKVLRFLSRSRLLTPLRRDSLLGRAILDGSGGYQEDRDYGVRVIDLGVMLAAADLEGTDLRWTDLSEANLIRANLARCDLVKTNLARTILCDSDLSGADVMGARLFYGSAKTASPRSRTIVPNYKTGAYTGAVIENADLSGVQRLSEDQRYYCCAWGGSKTRATIPGGCEGIPNLLGR
jgi:uncharacterized protein YjbI with pentapeptide repeats